MNDTELNKADKQQKSVTKEISKIILILIIPIAFVAYRYVTAPSAGFCVVQNRLISDKEFISKAVVAHESWLVTDSSKLDSSDFKIINCCVIRREESAFFSKIFHIQDGVMVSMATELSQKARDTTGAKNKYSIGHVYYFDSCGNSKRADLSPHGIYFGYDLNGDFPPTVNQQYVKNLVKWSK